MTRLLLMAALLALSVGCGSGAASFSPMPQAKMDGGARAPVAVNAAAPAGANAPANPVGAIDDRKIRYTATVEVVVKNLDTAQESLEALLKEKKGSVAKSEISGAVGDRRHGVWTLKVPSEAFRDVIAQLVRLGTLVRNTSDSEDLTEEYLDLDARLRNLRNEEEVMNKLLKESVTRLDDVLKMREQISKLRGDIERAEGRLAYLTKVTSYSTITLTLRENQDYTPPVTPTFRSEIHETFSHSVEGLSRFGQMIVLLLVGIGPWLPVIGLCSFIAWRLLRRRLFLKL